MQSDIKQKNKGFTLIEVMVAIFILTIAVSALITVTSSSILSARYASNEITANYLAEEVADYLKNDRDNVVFKQTASPTRWTDFLSEYGYVSSGTSGICFSAAGCYFDPMYVSFQPPTVCPSGGCPALNYHANGEYNIFYAYYWGTLPPTIVQSVFTRKITMSVDPARPDELDVTITVSWKNGAQTRTQTLQTTLLNWQK